MTIDQLETLEMIVEKGSFKAAAEALYKTQPSISVAIKKLEDEFDLKLFNRDAYRPKLTDEGVIFYNWAKQSLYSFRELKTIGLELGVKKIEPFLTIILDPLVRFDSFCGFFGEHVISRYPTEITFRSEIMSGGVNSLLSGEADFSVSLKAEDDDNIESIPFDKIEMIPVVAKSVCKKKSGMNAKSLKQIPQIVVLQQGNRGNSSKRDSRSGLADSRTCYVTDHSLKYKMITQGLGWGRLARHEVSTDLKKENLIEIKDPSVKSFTLDLHIMRSKNKPMGPVARTIWEQLSGQKAKPFKFR